MSDNHRIGMALALAAAAGLDMGPTVIRYREPEPMPDIIPRALLSKGGRSSYRAKSKDKTFGIKSKGRRGARERMLAMEAARRSRR